MNQVMRTFGWTPSDEELKDMVSVIDQVQYHHRKYKQTKNSFSFYEDGVKSSEDQAVFCCCIRTINENLKESSISQNDCTNSGWRWGHQFQRVCLADDQVKCFCFCQNYLLCPDNPDFVRIIQLLSG